LIVLVDFLLKPIWMHRGSTMPLAPMLLGESAF